MRLAALSLLVACGCADPGEEPWAGWERFSTDVGGYEFRYLVPPFEVVNDVLEDQGQFHIRVDSTHDDEVPPGLPALPPSFEIYTQPLPPGGTDAYANAKLAELAGHGDVPYTPCTPEEAALGCLPRDGIVKSRSGLAGHEVYTIDQFTRYYRYVYFALPTGSVVEVHIEMNLEPYMRDVDDLVDSFAAHP